MNEFFSILFDRRHVKDLRNWVLMVIIIILGAYHQFVVKPIQERQNRQGKRIRQIATATHVTLDEGGGHG